MANRMANERGFLDCFYEVLEAFVVLETFVLPFRLYDLRADFSSGFTEQIKPDQEV